jgi:hypothetical protein
MMRTWDRVSVVIGWRGPDPMTSGVRIILN